MANTAANALIAVNAVDVVAANSAAVPVMVPAGVVKVPVMAPGEVAVNSAAIAVLAAVLAKAEHNGGANRRPRFFYPTCSRSRASAVVTC